MSRKFAVLSLVFFIAITSLLAAPAATTAQSEHRGGRFTGPEVPALKPMLGDYCLTGVRNSEGRSDLPKLMSTLKQMGVTDYMHLVWLERSYPHAWEDFKAMAPLFQKEGIRLWLYLTPPSEKVPEPFGADYVRWARECATIANEFPIVQGIGIDDFNGNVKHFTPEYCKQMMSAAHQIAPALSLYVICYYGYSDPFLKPHVRSGAIDGIICPYYHPHRNHSNTKDLYPQAVKFRQWLNEQTKSAGFTQEMPLIWMVYGSKIAKAPDACTPGYVKECLSEARRAVRDGHADGVMMYCLPKDKPEFVNAVSSVYQAK